MGKHSGSSNTQSVLSSAFIFAILALAAATVLSGCATTPAQPPTSAAAERERYAAFGMWGMADGVSQQSETKAQQETTAKPAQNGLIRVPVTGEADVTRENLAQMQKVCGQGNQRVCLGVAMFKLKAEKDVKGIVAFCKQASVDCRLNKKTFPTEKKPVARPSAASWSTKTPVVSAGRDSELEVSVY